MAEADPPLDQELEVGTGVPVGGGQKRTPSGIGQRPCSWNLSVLDGGEEEIGWSFLFVMKLSEALGLPHQGDRGRRRQGSAP